MRSTSNRPHPHSQSHTQSQHRPVYIPEELPESSTQQAPKEARPGARVNVFVGLPPLAHETRPSASKSFSASHRADTFELLLAQWVAQSPAQELSAREVASKKISIVYTDSGIELDLSASCLSSLPTCLCSLTNLESLDASDNLLTHLPQLPSSLKKLHIQGNLFNELPVVPYTLSVLEATDNPWSQNATNGLYLLPQSIEVIL